MANNRQSEQLLNDRIAAIRQKNARLESRYREIELDKQTAKESGSAILPSQIKITISRDDIVDPKNNFYGRNKRQNVHERLGYAKSNISKSMSRLPQSGDNGNYNNYQSFGNNRPRGGGRKNYRQHNNNNNNPPFEYSRHIAIEPGTGCPRGGGGASRPPHYNQHRDIWNGSNTNQHRRNYAGGQRNTNSQNYSHQQQQQHISSAKSMPSLDGILQQGSFRGGHQRPIHGRGGGFGGGRSRGGGGSGAQSRPRNPNPRQIHHHNKQAFQQESPCCCCGGQQQGTIAGNGKPRQRNNSHRGGGGGHMPRDGPPPGLHWPQMPVPKSEDGKWVRGLVIRDKNQVVPGRSAAVTAIGIQADNGSVDQPSATRPAPPDTNSPFINDLDDLDGDTDDGYIDDNPLDDLDQFTLKIDMDGGFVVHDASICDPILAKPIGSWIDDVEDDDIFVNPVPDKEAAEATSSPSSSPPPPSVKEFSSSLPIDVECSIFSNSSLTTSGVSTVSSLDVRLQKEELSGRADGTLSHYHRALSADQIDKVTAPEDQRDFSYRTKTKDSDIFQVAWGEFC